MRSSCFVFLCLQRVQVCPGPPVLLHRTLLVPDRFWTEERAGQPDCDPSRRYRRPPAAVFPLCKRLHVCLCSDSAFVLEIPALPVHTGSEVTLQCRHKDGSAYSAYFFKDGEMVGGTAASQNLHEVRRSDEGLYWCSTDKSGSSPRSFLRVRGEDHDITSCLEH